MALHSMLHHRPEAPPGLARAYDVPLLDWTRPYVRVSDKAPRAPAALAPLTLLRSPAPVPLPPSPVVPASPHLPALV